MRGVELVFVLGADLLGGGLLLVVAGKGFIAVCGHAQERSILLLRLVCRGGGGHGIC